MSRHIPPYPARLQNKVSVNTEAILAHGGEARASRDAFAAMQPGDRRAIVTFLKTLQVRPPGSPRVVIEGGGAVEMPDLVVREIRENAPPRP